MRKSGLLLVILMLLSLCSVVFAEGTLENFTVIRNYEDGKFKDVPDSAWYLDSVVNAYEKGLVNGVTETSFNPDGEITIAETVTLAARIHSTYNANGYEFSQVGSAWYDTYVDYAVSNAVISAGEYSDFGAKCTRLQFAKIMAASVPEKEFAKINNIVSIPDLGSYDKEQTKDVYMLYNAGILTGSDELGTFNPEASIKRSEVSAILARITDTAQRKKFALPSDETETESKLFADLSKDDGTQSAVLCDLRLMFEQSALPESIFAQGEEFAKAWKEDINNIVTYIDDKVWMPCMQTIAIRYMSDSDETFVIANEDDIVKHITEIADRFSLHAYEHYIFEAMKFSDDVYCLMLDMEDIGDALKLSEMEKMFISSYVAIVYDDAKGEFSYFLLERSFDGYHMLCGYDKKGAHLNFGTCENDKTAFVNAVKELSIK